MPKLARRPGDGVGRRTALHRCALLSGSGGRSDRPKQERSLGLGARARQSASPGAVPKPSAAAVPSAVLRSTIDPVAPPAAAPPATAAAANKPLSARAIAAVRALEGIASAGATLLDLGAAHGMRAVFAKKRNACPMAAASKVGSMISLCHTRTAPIDFLCQTGQSVSSTTSRADSCESNRASVKGR